MRSTKKLLAASLAGIVGLASLAACTQPPTNTSEEQANMKLVSDFYTALEQDFLNGSTKVRSIAEQYLTPDYIQHMEAAQAFGPGREGYIRMFEQMPAAQPPPGGMKPPPSKVLTLMAEGDLVVRINSRAGGPSDRNPLYIFNLFRVENGRLAEHWDGYSRPIGSMGAAKPEDSSPAET